MLLGMAALALVGAPVVWFVHLFSDIDTANQRAGLRAIWTIAWAIMLVAVSWRYAQTAHHWRR
jgi:hypothetical protein